MKLKELDIMAYEMQILPAGLKMPETYYFLAIRSLYAVFLAGNITAEQAKEEKKSIIGTYRAFELVHRIGEHDMNILRQIQNNKDYYSRNGCQACRNLADQICGLEVKLTNSYAEGGA